jgi:hypothetical protein
MMRVLVILVLPVAAAMQQVHERTREQDQVRDDAEDVGTVLAPKEYHCHHRKGEKDPSPARTLVVPAGCMMLLLRFVHNGLQASGWHPTCHTGGLKSQAFPQKTAEIPCGGTEKSQKVRNIPLGCNEQGELASKQ